jgi:pimeloyl-ACP methyl ester carboxylesterase
MARFSICVALLLVFASTLPAAAQGRGAAQEIVPLVTKDGVQLSVTYYPAAQPIGSPGAKQVTPVVLLHDFKDTRAVFASLAQRLQAPAEREGESISFAAITVDLRGHGESTQQVLPDGSQIRLDAARIHKQGLQAMATFDMEAVRNFLVARNDAGELNLNKLCLIGAGMGASVAANWALQDWTAPPLAIGKQGQDVKGIVLVSPQWSFSGLSFQAPMRFRPLKEQVAWMIVFGDQDPRAAGDANRIRKQLERFHPKPDDAAKTSSSLELVGVKSKLQGTTLLRQSETAAEEQIVDFLVEQVAKRQQPWISRLDRLP